MGYKILHTTSPGSCGSMEVAVERMESKLNRAREAGAELCGNLATHTEVRDRFWTHHLFQVVLINDEPQRGNDDNE